MAFTNPVIGINCPDPTFLDEGEAPCFRRKRHMTGAYTDQREPTEEEVAIFRKVTGEGDMVLTPLSVSTQVVAGLNYKFWCRYEDSGRGVSGHCWVVIYMDLKGNATLTSIKKEPDEAIIP